MGRIDEVRDGAGHDIGGVTDLLDRTINRLYERARPNYFHVLVAVFAVWILCFVTPLYSLLGTSFYGWTIGNWVSLVVVSDICLLLATPGLVFLILRRHQPAVRWLRDAPDADPVGAWRSMVLGLPGTIVRGTIWCYLGTVPIIIYGKSLFDLSTASTLVWFAIMAVFLPCAGLFAYLMFERSLQPALREVAAELPPDFDLPEGGPSLPTKLLAILVLFSVFSGAFVGSFTVSVADTLTLAQKAAVLLGVSVVFTMFFALPLALLVRESVLTRLAILRRAMGRVDRGEYDAHIAPVGGDELDELGRSFNQMVGRLRGHEDQLRESRARIVAASDAARRRVERDLHDGAQQQLVTLRLRLGMARQAVDDPERVAALLDDAKDDLVRALEELRDLAHGIYPAALTTDGLHAALETAAERCPLPVAVEVQGGRLAADAEAAIYFCCVEALQNATKHAGPEARVCIRLDSDPDGVRFAVRDDGVGYDPAALGMSTGLQNMADRIGALGGALRIESAPGRGTAVIGDMPASQGAP